MRLQPVHKELGHRAHPADHICHDGAVASAGEVVRARAIFVRIAAVEGVAADDLAAQRLDVRVGAVIDQRDRDIVLERRLVRPRHFDILDLVGEAVHAGQPPVGLQALLADAVGGLGQPACAHELFLPGRARLVAIDEDVPGHAFCEVGREVWFFPARRRDALYVCKHGVLTGRRWMRSWSGF